MQPNMNPRETDCLNYTTADLTVAHENMNKEF